MSLLRHRVIGESRRAIRSRSLPQLGSQSVVGIVVVKRVWTRKRSWSEVEKVI